MVTHHVTEVPMLRTALLRPPTTVADTARRRSGWLRCAWRRLIQDDDERFLLEARDLAELEQRLRQLERGRVDRFGALPANPEQHRHLAR